MAWLAQATVVGALGIVSASEPEGLVSVLSAKEAKVRLDTDDFGDPNIRANFDGTNFSIYFYGCVEGRECTSIQFYAGYRTDGEVRAEEFNAWNSQQRFAKAYFHENGSSRLEMDVFTGRVGVSADDFDEMVGIWLRTMKTFEGVIGW